MGNYTAAVIGCGNIGAGVERYADVIQPWTHAGALQAHPSVTLIALVDTDAEKRQKAEGNFPGTPTYEHVEAMFQAGTPDIVAIAVPTAYHFDALMSVVERGVKAIICEKPIAATIEDGQKMIDACQKNGVVLITNHIRRFDTKIRDAKRDLLSMGDVLQANGHYTRGLFNNGTHLIDLMRYFLGDVESVIGMRNERTATYKDLSGDIDADAWLFFSSGARVAIQVHDSADFSVFELDFFARRGTVRVTQHGFRIERSDIVTSEAFPLFKEVSTHPVVVDGARSFMAPMVAHVVDCLDGRDTPVSSGEDGLAALRILAAIRKSADQGGERVSVS